MDDAREAERWEYLRELMTRGEKMPAPTRPPEPKVPMKRPVLLNLKPGT